MTAGRTVSSVVVNASGRNNRSCRRIVRKVTPPVAGVKEGEEEKSEVDDACVDVVGNEDTSVGRFGAVRARRCTPGAGLPLPLGDGSLGRMFQC